METFQNIDAGTSHLEAPHFDDELTVITAQPVVPLEVIAGEQTRRKRWLLAGAFALSLLLGAGSALLAIRIKRQVAQPAVVQSSDGEEVQGDDKVLSQNVQGGIQGGETPALAPELEDEPEVVESNEETAETPVAANKTVKNRETKLAQKNATKSRTVKKVEPVKEEQRQPRLVDQWEERRVRRVLRRERREQRQRQDLFRVGDIFEGSRGRNNPN
jgi:outer membrane biosynthesis protein TonB